MQDRRSLWADPKIQELVRKYFVPASDEVWRLKNRKGPDCDLFKKFCEDGHYGGRDGTRQGIYVASPSGKFLGSANNRDPRRIERMLRSALKKWNELPKKERYLSKDPKKDSSNVDHPRDQYPEGGLVVRVYSRDLPREGVPDDWRRDAWNQDYAWYKKDEAQKFLPKVAKKGVKYEVPRELVVRLVRHNFLDNVRGQTISYDASAVKTAVLRAHIKSVKRGVVGITFEGETKAEQDGRGVELRLRGEAKFDSKKGRFTEFKLVATGTRWGQTRYNFRKDDTDRAPIGYALTLAGDSPAERVAPAHLYKYGW